MYELVSPVNPVTILKYLGKLLAGIGVVLLVPLLVSLFFGSGFVAGAYAAIAAGIALSGYLLHRLLPDRDLEWKEALVIAGLIFPISSLISAVPIALSTGMAPIDALFETVSGLTTTGLSVAPADAGPVFLFSRAWLQWIGGIGIVLIVLSVFVPPGISAFRLFTANIGEQQLRPGVVKTASLLVRIYLGITIVAFLLLLASGMPAFDAVCHALSTVSTGGFSTETDSIAAFPGFLIPFVVTLSCIMGAVNFALFPRLLDQPRSLFSSVQFLTFLLIGVAGALLLFGILSRSYPLPEAVSLASFQAFSALTSAGFSTTDIGLLPDSAKALLTVLMWIGGSVGSTAGGIKILRVIVLFRIIHLVFIRFFLPKEALTPLKVRDRVIENDDVTSIVSFVMLYLMVTIGSAFIFMLYGIDMGDAVFEVSSALGTVGLSCGITDVAMPPVLKGVLIIDMLLGRIEIIPLCIVLFPRTWYRRRIK
jgi:trk system potassium uptake protein TrkH